MTKGGKHGKVHGGERLRRLHKRDAPIKRKGETIPDMEPEEQLLLFKVLKLILFHLILQINLCSTKDIFTTLFL